MARSVANSVFATGRRSPSRAVGRSACQVIARGWLSNFTVNRIATTMTHSLLAPLDDIMPIVRIVLYS